MLGSGYDLRGHDERGGIGHRDIYGQQFLHAFGYGHRLRVGFEQSKRHRKLHSSRRNLFGEFQFRHRGDADANRIASYYPFQSWSGSCSGSGACSVTMSAAEAVGAEFCGPPQYPCSSISTAIKQTPNSAPFSGGTGYNQVAYDISGLNAFGLNPLVRITDGTMLSGHSPSSTFTGGDNDAGWSCTGRADLSTACGAAFALLSTR